MPGEKEPLQQSQEELPSIEELERVQAEHEAERARLEEEAARRQAEEAEVKRRAAPLAAEHRERVRAARGLHRDIRTKESGGVIQRMEQTEALRVEEIGLVADLETRAAEFEKARQYLARVEQLAAGKEDIADQVQRTLVAAQEQVGTLDGPVRDLEARLKNVRERQISPQEAAEYRALQEKMAETIERIHEISQDPHVMEVLMNNAETEEGIRQEFLDAALRENGWRTEGVRADIVSRATQRFLTEEIDRAGINALTDPATHREALRALANNMLVGLQTYRPPDESAERLDTDEERRRFYSGVVLKALVLQPGLLESLPDYLARSETGQKQDPYGRLKHEERKAQAAGAVEAFNEAVGKHLETLNMLRAYALEIDENHSNAVPPVRMNAWNEATSKGLWRDPRSQYVVEHNGPILPRAGFGEPSLMVATQERYEADREAARKIERSLLEADIAVRQESLVEEERALEELKAKREKIRELELAANPSDLTRVQEELYELGKPLYNWEENKRRSERELERLGRFHPLERRRYERQIKDSDAQINTRKARIKPLLERIAAVNKARDELQELRRGRNVYTIGQDIERKEKDIADLRRRLDGLQKKLAGVGPTSAK